MNSNRLLVVDNRDSFVFNLVADFARLGLEATVVRGEISSRDFEALVDEIRPRLVLLSPGPGRPQDCRLMTEFLEGRPELPVLGICLGMQAVALSCGGDVSRAPSLVHGKATVIRHRGDPVFDGIGPRFAAGRYHSLAVTHLPEELEEIAWTSPETEGASVVMGLRHRDLPWYGFQFHPESILTPCGPQLLKNFLERVS